MTTAEDTGPTNESYVRRVLDVYRNSPQTTGRVNGADRRLARSLFLRRVPLEVIETAVDLATARRLVRSPQAPPLGLIRSLAYLLPVIEELLAAPPAAGYRDYLARTVASLSTRLQP